MYCTNCGALNSDNASHCTNCGVQLQVNQPVNNTQPINNVLENIPEIKAMPEKDPGKGLAIAALILGIVSILSTTVCCCIPFVNYISPVVALVTAIVGMILASRSKAKSEEADYDYSTMAKVGKILSIISLIISIIATVITIVVAILAAVGILASSSGSYYYY